MAKKDRPNRPCGIKLTKKEAKLLSETEGRPLTMCQRCPHLAVRVFLVRDGKQKVFFVHRCDNHADRARQGIPTPFSVSELSKDEYLVARILTE